MEDKNQQADFGLGERVIEENRTRFINKDGTFNVHRKGVSKRSSFSPYHAVLRASWWSFNLGILIYYIVINFIFTILYMMSGKTAFPDIVGLSASHRFGQLFFYSVQVITTLGTSPLHPNNTFADIVLALEAMAGMLGFALAASLLFARFSNPSVKIIFSDEALIVPYKDITGFMFRIINGRNNEMVDAAAIVTMSISDMSGKRHVHRLNLERDMVSVFPLNWTIVHPIDTESPLYGLTEKDLHEKNAEFLISLKAVDQDLSKTVYVRSSYTNDEILFGYKFKNILEKDETGTVIVDPKRISDIEKI